MRRLFIVWLIIFIGLGAVKAQEELTETPEPSAIPEDTPTPDDTATPTPDIVVYSTVVAPGETEGQTVAFRYEITAGEAANTILLFALVTLGLIQLVSQIRRGRV